LWLTLAAPAAETRDLILVAGQFNAVGADTTPTELPPSNADREIMFWWRTGDPPPDKHDSTSSGAWKRLQTQPLGNPKLPRDGKNRQWGNFSHPQGGFGPEIGMARTLSKKQPKRRLAIVKAAFSGTGIRRDWDPKSDTESGSCYRALLKETRDAIKAATAKGITLKIRALAWVQGESDANPANVEHYEKALNEMIAALRRDLNAPDMIALVAVNTRFGGGRNKLMPDIVKAQRAVGAADKRAAYVDTAKATIANNAHYDTKGTLYVGRLFAEALLEVEGED
jgi:hypothetical protein